MKTLLAILLVLFSNFSICQSLQERVLVVKNINSSVSIAVAYDYKLRRNVNKFIKINCYDNYYFHLP